MRLNFKDLLIAIMFVFILALMVLVYKVNTLVVDRIPNRIEPEVYAMGLTEAIERQNQTGVDLAYTVGWMKRHFDRCLTLIESERGLEPIPIKYPDWGGPQPSEGYFLNKEGPFVMPYEKPKHEPDQSPREKNLKHLECLVNLSTMAVTMSMYSVEMEIENFQQRLQRIAPDPEEN